MINICGTIFGTTGYDIHTRQLANALHKQTKTRLSIPLIPDWQRHVNDAELEMITTEEQENEITLIIAIPHFWKLYTKPGRNWAYCIWEGDRVPACWLEEFMNPDIEYIFVASEHTKLAIASTINHTLQEEADKVDNSKYNKEFCEKLYSMKNKIKVIPHGVDLEKFYPQQKNATSCVNGEIPTPAETFKFVCNKGWRGTDWDRGGVQYVLKAFAEEFSKEEEVELLIKLNPAYIDGKLLSQYVENLNLDKDRAPINICLDIIPYEKLIDFYHKGNVFVCATRAEAFNIPGIEAMGCGLPTIQTNFGGQVDYMTDENSWFIDYKKEEVKIKEELMYEGICWATPDIEDLKKKMRYCFEHQDEVKKKGKQALEDSKKWTWDITTSRLKKLEEVNKK